MKKILITGFFGVDNLGDEIMLTEFLSNVASSQKLEITVLNLYGKKKKFENLPHSVRLLNVSWLRYGKKVLFNHILSRYYDAFFWVGGTCFTENAGDGSFHYMKSFQKKGKKYGYIGIGIGNLKSQNKIKKYQFLLSNASLVTFRDKESFEFAQNLSSNKNMYLCEDLVYLSKNFNLRQDKTNAKHLIISWRNLSGYFSNEQELMAIEQICSFVKENKKNIEKITVCIFGNNIDYSKNLYIYNQLVHEFSGRISFETSLCLNEKISLIKNANFIITGRLHAIFLAELNNTNTIAIGYDNKIERFLKSLGTDAINDLVTPTNLNYSSLDFAFHNKPNISPEIVEKKIKLATENITLFNDLLE